MTIACNEAAKRRSWGSFRRGRSTACVVLPVLPVQCVSCPRYQAFHRADLTAFLIVPSVPPTNKHRSMLRCAMLACRRRQEPPAKLQRHGLT